MYTDALDSAGVPLQGFSLPFLPRQVLLFSGHMVDAPGRPRPRFPAHKVPAAAQRIAQALDVLGAADGDLALTQGAAGGDLLFAQACLARSVRVQLLLPLPEPQFIERSILPSTGGEHWREVYFAVKAACADPPRVMDDELGLVPNSADVFERCNRWLLNTALTAGIAKLRLVCLWDGSGGDGRGGTAHMVREVERRAGHISWIDVRDL